MKTTLLAVAACIAMVGTADAQSFGFGTFSAFIAVDGSVTLSSGLQSSARTGTGKYLLTFTRAVGANCVFVATPRGTAGGQISISRTNLGAAQIQVNTFDSQGSAANLSFSVIASCSAGSP